MKSSGASTEGETENIPTSACRAGKCQLSAGEAGLFIISATLRETVKLKRVTEIRRMNKEAGAAGLLIIAEWVLKKTPKKRGE